MSDSVSSLSRLWFPFVAVLGGLVGGGVVTWLAPPRATADPSVADLTEPASPQESAGQSDAQRERPGREAPAIGKGDEAKLQARIERLETMLRRLQRQQARQATLQALPEGAAEAGAGGGSPVSLNAADPRFEQAVRTVIDRAAMERAEKRTDQREDRRDRRVTRKVDYLSEKLGLNEEQQKRVDQIFMVQSEAMRELFRGEDRPVTRKQWRARMDAIREVTNQKLQGVLTEEQKRAYAELENEEGFNKGWFAR